MSIKLIESILTETKKLAKAGFIKEFETFAKTNNLGNKSSKGIDIFRDELNTSIHTVSYSDVRKFIVEHQKSIPIKSYSINTSSKLVGRSDTIKESTDIYFAELLKQTKNYYRHKDTIFFLVGSKIVKGSEAEKALIDLFEHKRADLPSGYQAIIDAAKPPRVTNIYNLVKSTFEEVNIAIKTRKNIPAILTSFIESVPHVGHVTSNITYFTNIAVVSGFKVALKNNVKDIGTLYSSIENPQIKDAIKKIYLANLLGTTDINLAVQEAIFEYIYDSQLSLSRIFTSDKVLKGVVTLKFSEEKAIGTTLAKAIRAIVKKALVKVAPQNPEINSKIGRDLEARVRTHLPLFYGAIRELAVSELNSIEVDSLKGSKSYRELLLDHVTDIILTGKSKQAKSTITTVNSKKSIGKKTFNPLNNPVKNTNSKQSISKKSSTYKLRSTSGAFQSVANLQGLLAARLQEVIRKNMAPPALTYQTGRFVESVKLNAVQFDNRENSLTAFLTYMKYPYATFEPGGRQGNIDRSPAALIDRSVREIAVQLTKSRMRTIIV